MPASLDVHGLRASGGIAFVGNYLPRRCGIATFTYDLAEAVAEVVDKTRPVTVTAIDDHPTGYRYPKRVNFTIAQDRPIDYRLAAESINFGDSTVVSLQHEFGIFGGAWGANVLTLLRTLRKPVVVTCHTVDPHPEPIQQEIFREVAARSDRLVVMNRRANAVLENVYGVDRHKIAYIRHGIHDVPFVTSRGAKSRAKRDDLS